MKEILYILLPQYADHEMPFLALGVACDEMGIRQHPRYVNKVVSLSLAPVISAAGVHTLPDYSLDTMPDDYAAIVLLGGYGWMGDEAERVTPVVAKAMKEGKPIGAICNAASWMAKQGFLNEVMHTGNGVEQLKMWGGTNYTNEAGYRNEQAVSDRSIVTANGTGYLEFARLMLLLLENDTEEMIERYYSFNKQGFVALSSLI